MIESESPRIHDVASAQEFLREFPAYARNRGKQLLAQGMVRQLRRDEEGRGYTAQVQAQ